MEIATTKKLTVGVLTYNNPQGLEVHIDTIVSQIQGNDLLEKEIEVLVSDNSDNTDTKDLVEKKYRELPWFTYSKNPVNIGFDRNVDAVLTKAKGLFCWTLSDNDTIAPAGIAAMYDVVKAHATAGHIIISELSSTSTPIVYTNTEALLRERNYETIVGGLISRNVFNTAYLPQKRGRYYDNQWFHLSVALEVGATHTLVLAPDVFLHKEDGVCGWAKNGHTFITFTSLHAVVMNLGEFGYSQEFLRTYHRAFLRALPHQIVTGKLYGLRFARKSILLLYKHTNKDLSFFCIGLILLAIPTPFYKLARILWKKL